MYRTNVKSTRMSPNAFLWNNYTKKNMHLEYEFTGGTGGDRTKQTELYITYIIDFIYVSKT